MYFVSALNCSFVAIDIDDELSTKILVGLGFCSSEVCLFIISQKSFRIQVSSLAQLDIATCSASPEERLITVCKLDFQYIGNPLIANKPEVEIDRMEHVFVGYRCCYLPQGGFLPEHIVLGFF